MLALGMSGAAGAAAGKFSASNPFYAPSTLPFQAPPFDRIKDGDYQPAIEAGMRRQRAQMRAIAANPAAPTFQNTFVAMERSGRLLQRSLAAFRGVGGADTDPALQKAKAALAPQLAAHENAIYLNRRLFARVAALYRKRAALHLDPESLRLVEVVYRKFVHSGAQLAAPRRTELQRLNVEISTLSNAFEEKLLAATKNGALRTTRLRALAGLGKAAIAAAAQAAASEHLPGYLLALQNTTQQPALASLSDRQTRRALFENSWNRAERGDGNDTRHTIARIAQLRARRAQLLGYPNYAAWKLEDQMAKTPQAAFDFLDQLIPLATRTAERERAAIQALAGKRRPGLRLAPWDWNYYGGKLREAKFALDERQIRPYFLLSNVLKNGVFYAAHELYGISFRERKDIPVYQPDVRVFEVFDGDGKPLALFYCDYFKRDNKNGGAWMSEFVGQSKLLGTLPVVYNVANFTKAAAGEPALIGFDDVTTMFHEFGHALNGMFSDAEYPTLSGTATARDFVEFPSQFNEHWALYPAVFDHYARDYRSGAPMPAALAAKLVAARNFNEGYDLTELLAAAELDMQWHSLPAGLPLQDPDKFEARALRKAHLALAEVPPRYRSTYFSHIWSNGYAAGYYSYLWTEMLADDGFQWFADHGGLTRANGDRFRRMILSRGNTEDLAKMYRAWRGREPSVAAMMKYRGLSDAQESK